MRHLPTRKKIRFAPSAYDGPAVFSVTIATSGRKLAFENRDVAAICTNALGEAAASHSMAVLAHCLMPDHLHLVVEARPGANLHRLHEALQAAVRLPKDQFDLKLWQKGYYDHVMRGDEELLVVALHIRESHSRGISVRLASIRTFWQDAVRGAGIWMTLWRTERDSVAWRAT